MIRCHAFLNYLVAMAICLSTTTTWASAKHCAYLECRVPEVNLRMSSIDSALDDLFNIYFISSSLIYLPSLPEERGVSTRAFKDKTIAEVLDSLCNEFSYEWITESQFNSVWVYPKNTPPQSIAPLANAFEGPECPTTLLDFSSLFSNDAEHIRLGMDKGSFSLGVKHLDRAFESLVDVSGAHDLQQALSSLVSRNAKRITVEIVKIDTQSYCTIYMRNLRLRSYDINFNGTLNCLGIREFRSLEDIWESFSKMSPYQQSISVPLAIDKYNFQEMNNIPIVFEQTPLSVNRVTGILDFLRISEPYSKSSLGTTLRIELWRLLTGPSEQSISDTLELYTRLEIAREPGLDPQFERLDKIAVKLLLKDKKIKCEVERLAAYSDASQEFLKSLQD